MPAKANLNALLTALVSGVQTLENAFVQLRDTRNIDDSTGATLDQLGKLVGQPRNGLADDVYRRFIRARIAVNRSLGLTSDVIRIIELLLGDDGDAALITVQNQGVAAVEVNVTGVEDLDVLPTLRDEGMMDFLGDGVKAGVRIILRHSYGAPGFGFVFDGGVGLGFATFAKLDMATPWDSIGTVIAARTPGVYPVYPSIQTIADGTGAGQFSDGLASVFHFEDGVTLCSDFEAAIATSAYLQVYTPSGVPADPLEAVADEFTGSVAGGVEGGKFAEVRDNHSESVFA